MLSAMEYAKSFNPGDTVDEDSIVDTPVEHQNTSEGTDDGEESIAKEGIDIESIISSLPEGESVTPIADWKKYFDGLNLSKIIVSAVQEITNIKSHAL